MSLENIIDRIAKLRRLATSNNANEAAAAAAAADKLMQEHGIAEAQLEAAGERTKEEPIKATDPVAQWVGGKTPTWGVMLASGLIRHYDCSCYIDPFTRRVDGERWERGKRIVAFGRPSDLENVRYVYAWLSVEIERLAKKNAGNGRAWINSFRVGAVRGCLDAMRSAKEAAREEARAAAARRSHLPDGALGTSTVSQPANLTQALVLVDARAVEARALRDKMAPKLRSTGSFRTGSSSDGYHAGREVGSRLGAQHGRLATGGARALKG